MTIPVNNISQSITVPSFNSSIETRIDSFINEINQLGVDINKQVQNYSLVDLQDTINEYDLKLQLASKVASTLVKSINTLTNSS